MRLLDWLHAEIVIPEPVKTASKSPFFVPGSPDPSQALNELLAPTISFSMLQPPLANTGELGFELSADYVHGDSTVRVVVDACDLLCGDGRIPRTGENRGDKFYPLRMMEESVREGHEFVLLGSTVACRETCRASISNVRLQVMVRLLGYLRDDKAGDVWNPIPEC